MKVKGCYGNTLDDCKGEISKEHEISQSHIGDTVFVSIKNQVEEHPVKKNDLVLYNLCEGHNNYLGHTEIQHRHFLDFLVAETDRHDAIRKSKKEDLGKFPVRIKVRGSSIEKWYLKTFINYCYRLHHPNIPNFNFKYLNARLFGKEIFPYPYGLSFMGKHEGKPGEMYGGINFSPMVDEDETIFGGVINMQGFLFFIWLPSVNTHIYQRKGILFNDKRYIIGRDMAWHPPYLEFKSQTIDGEWVNRSYIQLNWKNPGEAI